MINIKEENIGTNEINIRSEAYLNSNITLDIYGSNNRISIETPHKCTSLYIRLTGNNHLSIKNNCVFFGQSIQLLAPGTLSIGNSCSFNGHSVIHMHETATIAIGNGCLFGSQVSISSSHVHKILDLTTGERLNPPGDIEIENHVWLSEGANLWGGARIGHDSVVGKDVYVSKAFPSNCVIAGVPARVIREGITWAF
ncbi:MAG: hypothetical protein PHT60_14440 [Acidiphilium sp.]|nr:hypothetical protein [Acidiphilium sp.]MDD4936960.1 hypothetical protein [Acidiphilium sp.]